MKTLDLTCHRCLKRVASQGGMARHISSCRKNPKNWCADRARDHTHTMRFRRHAQTLPLLAAYARDILGTPQSQADDRSIIDRPQYNSSTNTAEETARNNAQDLTLALDTHDHECTPAPYQVGDEGDLGMCTPPSSNDQAALSSADTRGSRILSATSLQSLFRVSYGFDGSVPAGQSWRVQQAQQRCV